MISYFWEKGCFLSEFMSEVPYYSNNTNTPVLKCLRKSCSKSIKVHDPKCLLKILKYKYIYWNVFLHNEIIDILKNTNFIIFELAS